MNWDLQKLYKGFDDPAYLGDVKAFQDLTATLLERAQTLDIGVDTLEDILHDAQSMTALEMKTFFYALLTLAADANNGSARAAYDRLMPAINQVEQFYSALSARLESADLESLTASSPLVKEHSYLLRKLKRGAAHVIDPTLEPAVLKMQLTGGSAWSQLRDQLDSNLMIDFECEGRNERLPLSAIRGMAHSADGEIRRRAYEAELAAYPRIEIPMAACLNGIKGEAITLSELKRYDSVLDMALDVACMDRQTLDALMDAMKESLPMFRRYFRLKARMLGYDGGLKFYDLFAPVGKLDADYTVEAARDLLVRELGAFSPRLGRMIDRAFEERWIDLYPREGKQGGAFCETMHPLGISYILANFEGSYSSVSTLAHELGHAYQNECMKDVSILQCDYPMPLAETASIFNEMLLAERMLAGASPEAGIALLEQQISDAAQVIVDIMSRYLFEYEVIERRKDHALSAKEMCEIMLDAQRKTYGDGLDACCMHPYMWACKPHYYSTGTHFYNFPYAFGQLFAVGVYAIYQRKGTAFLPDYEKLLRDAGSGDVREVAASVGIDVTDREFWRASLKVFEDKIDQLEKLANGLR